MSYLKNKNFILNICNEKFYLNDYQPVGLFSLMNLIFYLFSFSFCKKAKNETQGIWNWPKVKELQKTGAYKQVSSFFDSFSPKNSNSSIVSSSLNDFRNSLISYKKSILLKREPKYQLHKKKINSLRKGWNKADEMKKKGIEIPENIKKVLSSFRLPKNVKDIDIKYWL